MVSRHWRKVLKASLHLNDLRGITYILLGTCIYLVLFSAFGLPAASTLTVEPKHDFPRKLWQSWKRAAISFDEKEASRLRSWIRENPTLRYEVLTDDNALPYVEQVFGPKGFDRPDVVLAYQLLRADIVKADLLRYIVMYAEGGIYADVDVEALMPFDDFIPRTLDEKNIDMIIGVETDMPAFKNHPILGVKAQSFCQWTFACKRRVPVMLRLINNIVAWLDRLQKVQRKEIPDLEFDFDTVLNVTGPSAFTTAILQDMSESTGHTVEWAEFHRLRDPKVINGILVLPAQSFAASTGHSESGSHISMGALVKHHFGASSWTKKHQRHKHPVYGEVERCNWDSECVALWDANTAEFDALPQADQLRIIEAKQAETLPSPQKSDDKSQKEAEPEAEAEQEADTLEDEDGAELDSTASRLSEAEIPDVTTLENLLMQDDLGSEEMPDAATLEDESLKDT